MNKYKENIETVNIVDDKPLLLDGLHRYSNSLLIEILNLNKKIKFNSVIPKPIRLNSLFLKITKSIFDIDFVLKKKPLFLKLPKADITHIMNQSLCFPLSFKFFFRKENSDQKIIATIHDIMPLTHKICRKKRPLSKLSYSLSIRGIQNLDSIITISECIKDDINKILNFPRDRIFVVYEGVDKERFRILKNIKKPLIFKKGYFNMIFVGSEIERKNLRRIFKAFALVKKRHPKINLIKVGAPVDQKQRKALLKLIKSKRLESSIIFTNHIKEDELPIIYNCADLLVFTTLYEGFGLPPIEAMACGCPVLGSTTGSQPEIIEKAALLVNPYSVDEIAKGMEKFITNQRLRKKLIKDGLRLSKQYTWKKAAEKTIKVYKNVCIDN